MYYLHAACNQVYQTVTAIPDHLEETLDPATADMLRKAAYYAGPAIGAVVIDTVLNNIDPKATKIFISFVIYAALRKSIEDVDAHFRAQTAQAQAGLAANGQSGVRNDPADCLLFQPQHALIYAGQQVANTVGPYLDSLINYWRPQYLQYANVNPQHNHVPDN